MKSVLKASIMFLMALNFSCDIIRASEALQKKRELPTEKFIEDADRVRLEKKENKKIRRSKKALKFAKKKLKAVHLKLRSEKSPADLKDSKGEKRNLSDRLGKKGESNQIRSSHVNKI